MDKTWPGFYSLGMAGYIDAHSHLADLRLAGDLPGILSEARKMGVQAHLQGGVGPDDWKRQLELHKQFPEIWPVLGLHPYWIADHSANECEQALDQLAKLLPSAYALGEVGLDFRPKIMKDSRALQIQMMEDQLALAEVASKPCVFHLVRAFEEALQIFEVHGVPKKSGMIHSFNGSAKQAEAYLNLGLYLSVGGPVTRPDNQRLHQAVQQIPLDRILLETDAPDQVVHSKQGHLGRSSHLFEVAEAVAKIKGLSVTELLDKSQENLKNLLQI